MATVLDLEPPVSVPLPRGIDLPYSDGVPMESGWHVKAMWLLVASVEQHWKGRTDFYAGGNNFFYFDPAQARNNNFRGPDFYVVKGVSHDLRRSWVAWEEGDRVPDVIVELLSPSTADTDRVTKKRVYLEQLDVKEYYCYDPDGPLLEGWRKGTRKPVAIKPAADGRLWSEELELFLGSWDGEHYRQRAIWPRFFDATGGLVLHADEVADLRTAAEAARAESEAARATAEAARANTAEAELAKLRAQLAALTNARTE